MLVTDIVRRAVSGSMRFDFIESTVTVVDGGVLSSQKGRAHCDPGDDTFLYHFQPRGAFREDWTRAGGYFDSESRQDPVSFNVTGVERSSAAWHAANVQLRLVHGAAGAVAHGRVQEWSRVDQHSVRSAFSRVIVPGHFLYPDTIRHAAGLHTRGAAVSVGGVRVEFRDYGHYTEISAINATELPERFPEYAVLALERVLQKPLSWVYKERHMNSQRIMSVQQIAQAASAVLDPHATQATMITSREFWSSYSEELTALL